MRLISNGMKTLLTMVLIIAAIVLVAQVARPIWSDIRVLRLQQKEVAETLSKLRELQALREELLTTYNSIPADKLERLYSMLPPKPDVGNILVSLEKLTKDRGIKLRSINFAKEQSKQAVPTGRIVQKPAGVSSNAVSYTFAVSAGYDIFRSLLAALEKNLRIVDVTDVTFSAAPVSVFEFTLRSRSYYQGEIPSLGKTTLELLEHLKTIKIDTSFFDDQQFTDLEAIPSPSLEGLQKGRPNPFTPASKR